MKIENGYEKKVIIENTRELVKVVNISYYNNTPTLSTDTYERHTFDESDRAEYAVSFVSECFGGDMYENNPDTTFNDFVRELAEDTDEFIDMLGDVIAMKELNNNILAVYQLVGCGQDFEEGNPFTEVHSKYHLKEFEDFPKELEEAIARIEKTVVQEPIWEDLSYYAYSNI